MDQQQPKAQPTQPAQPAKLPPVQQPKAKGPKFFGYRPPKWASDFTRVKSQKGKGSSGDAETWLVYTVDRLLKMHSL